MKKQMLMILTALLFILSCQSTGGTKRIQKDIIGINEQLYELEKNQITLEENQKKIAKKIIKTNKTTDKKKKNNIRQLYSKGYKLFLEEKYSDAILTFQKIVSRYSNDSFTDNTLFWLAESYLKLNKLKKALVYFKVLYRDFPFSEKADYALYKIGFIFYKQKDYVKADLAFLRLLKEYPYSDFKRSAINYRNKIKKNRRRK